MQLFDEPRGRKRPAGYLPLFDDATLRDEPVSESEVTQQERDSILQQIGELTGGTVSRVADTLAVPGDYARGVMAGKPGERLGGRDLLREFGLASQDDNWGNFISGTAVEAFTDPLALLSGPAAALTAAGKAAKKLNLLDSAATAATRKAISSGAAAGDALPYVAKMNRKALEKTGRTLSTFDPATTGRPLYGKRTARRASTLDDVIRYSDDPVKAEREARLLLGDQLDDLRNQTLSKSFGVGLPFQDPTIVGDLFGKGFGDNYADVLDTVGQGVRWSYPGRVAAAAFDNRVAGAVDAEEQITNAANFAARSRLGGIAKEAHAERLAKLYAEDSDRVAGTFSEEGNRRIGRVIEGTATPEDAAFVKSRPELQNWIDSWRHDRHQYIEESRAMGLSDAEVRDKYGIEYLPRRAEAALEMAGRSNRTLGKALTTMTGDQLGRTDAMQIPGGRDTIIDLSRDTQVSGAKRALASDNEAAQYLLDKLQPMVPPGGPELEMPQMLKLARVLNSLPDDVVTTAPLFGQHPTEMIGSYLKGRNEAMGTAGTLYDSLATMAKNKAFGDVEGGRHISLAEAAKRLNLRSYDEDVFGELADGVTPSGASQQLRERLAKLSGADPDDINIASFSVSEEHVNKLARARDAFTTDEASSELVKFLDHLTQAWKGSILTWPARSVRDLYSGAASNWLVGAFDVDSVMAAKQLYAQGAKSPAFLEELLRIPRYQGLNEGEAIARFYGDMAGTGIASGGAVEFGGSTIGNRALDPIIGANPLSFGGAVAELGGSWRKKDFFTWRSQMNPSAETLNPIMRAGEKANALTDGVNRVSGMLSLLKQGYTPDAAAATMRRVHADFSSLTSFERGWLKNLFPWYSYQSRIFREVLGQLAERPGGRYGQLMQATENAQESAEDTYIPSGVRSQFAVAVPEIIPDWLGGNTSPNVTRFLTDLDLPGYDQINMLETPGTVAGSAAGTARQIAMQLHPLARQGVEMAVNRDLFTNRPLGESTSGLDAIVRSVTGNDRADVPAFIEKTVENTPFVARPLGVARSLLDNRGDTPMQSRALKTLLNATTGMKVRDVAQEDALADAVRQIEESIDPYTREFQQVFIPEAMQPNVPQWAVRRLAVSRALGRERREARKPKGKKDAKKRRSDDALPSLFE